MNTIFLFVILQFNLFGSSAEPIANAKINIENAASQEIVGFTKIGFSGKFMFSNLDPGNYYLSIEIPEHAVRKLDKKSRQKYDTDIEVAFNSKKDTYCWLREDGYMKIELNRKSKVADAFVPLFEETKTNKFEAEELKELEEKDEPKGLLGNIVQKEESKTPQKIYFLQLTVIDQFGSIGGEVLSTTQKDFHKLTVGNKDITLESSGDVKVLKR